jgi:signal transduction histidine kinase
VVGATIGIGYLIKVTLRNNRLSAEIVKADKAERLATANLHIAAEIHDLLGHDLSLLALSIEVARITTAKDPSSVDHVLESLAHRARSAMGSLSDLVLDLSKDQSTSQLQLMAKPFEDVVPLVKEIVISANSAGLEISFACPDQTIIAEDTICNAIIHLAKEAITNLSNHSVSNKGVFTLSKSSKGIHLELLDDGPMDTLNQRNHQGAGLINCQKRAQSLGGYAGFSLVSDSNKGSFTAFIPWINSAGQ